LVAFVAAAQVTVFRDEDSIPVGDNWRNTITEALGRCERVFVFWCAHAADSREMETEYTTAIALGKRVIPVLIDSTPLPMGLCDFQALDMRGLLAQSHDAKLDELAAYVQQREARQGVAITSAGVAPPDWAFEAARAFAILANQ
jgi:TIR domain